jgi:pyruvate dehydrogenase E1 component alpha subunit
MDRDGIVGSGDPERDGAVVCYFGDGATSQGDVNEALNFAAVYNAPVVFFCQNNQFAISEPTTRQTIVPIAQRASGFGIPGLRVDGNDVIASYVVTQWAMERARSGQGPALIEAFTYRMGAHTTSDDPTRYRLSIEEDYWRERDPIARLDAYLTALGELSQEFREQVTAEAKALGERTRAFVKSAVPGDPAQIFDNVYAEPHATVQAERAWFEKYEQSFVGAATTGGHR